MPEEGQLLLPGPGKGPGMSLLSESQKDEGSMKCLEGE